MNETLRQPAEARYADELAALEKEDKETKPANWRLSPRAVLKYVCGDAGLNVGRKFFGDDALVERAIVTLASERALLLIGDPGCGKSWLSEHLAAAISGNSTLTIQGTAGTTEEQIKYSWNIARVIAEGPRRGNLIPSPTLVAMQAGALLRFEEMTRCLPDVQDSLVSILSDKAVAVPELPGETMIWAKPGFNVIATANTRDQGVNELSAALKRRFNYIHIPVVSDPAIELEIVRQRFSELALLHGADADMPPSVLEILITVFRELRQGKSEDGATLTRPSTTVSTAEAIGSALDGALHARFFGGGRVSMRALAANLVGSIVKEDPGNLAVLKEYATVVARRRGLGDPEWAELHAGLLAELP